MKSLANKQVVLGVTGGIAAYKSAELVRLLQQEGATVRVVMTSAAREFITPLTQVFHRCWRALRYHLHVAVRK